MSLVEKVRVMSRGHMESLAKTIERELKNECPIRSGEARRAIGIHPIDENHVRIGGKNLHLFFADQGNNQRLRTIKPTKAKALRFEDGTFHASASTYRGKHFVREVANRHR